MSTSDPCSWVVDSGLAVVTLHHAPHNLLGPVLMQSLLDALDQAKAAGARAVLVQGIVALDDRGAPCATPPFVPVHAGFVSLKSRWPPRSAPICRSTNRAAT